jgi:hypothetical protein
MNWFDGHGLTHPYCAEVTCRCHVDATYHAQVVAPWREPPSAELLRLALDFLAVAEEQPEGAAVEPWELLGWPCCGEQEEEA